MILAILILYLIATVLLVYELVPIVRKWVCVPKEKPTVSTGGYISVNREEALGKNWETIQNMTKQNEQVTSAGKFSVGDRVKAYSYNKIAIGTVHFIYEDYCVIVEDNGLGQKSKFFIKQCRKLKKKSPTIRVSKEELLKVREENFALKCYDTEFFNLLWNELVKLKGEK